MATPDLNALNAQLGSLAESLRRLAQSQSNFARETNVYSDIIDDTSADLDALREKFKKQGQVSVEQERTQRKLLKAKEDELAALRQLKQEQARLLQLRRNRANMSANEYKEQLANTRNNINNARDNMRRSTAEANKQGEKLRELRNSIGDTSKRFYLLAGVLSKLGSSLLHFNKVFVEASSASAGVIEETTGNFDQGLGHWLMALNATGVASKTMLDLMARNRQVVNSLGGMVNAVKTVEGAVFKTYGLYGSMEEAWKQNLSVMTEFANKGVSPSITLLEDYNNDLDMLARMTGMSGEAMNSMINEISNDIDSMSLLRAAREGEREAILANQRALLKSNIELGMTAKQAAEAAKMLNKMVAQKPLERLKQAARMRAIGAAMGLGSEANAAATELSKAKGQQNLETINAFSIALATQSNIAAQQGIIPEIQNSVLVDKLGFEDVVQTFDTNLSQTNKSLLDLRQDYKSSSSSVIMAVNFIADVAGQMLSALLDGTILWGGILDATRLIAIIPRGIAMLGTVIFGGLASLNEYLIDSINKKTPDWFPKIEKPEAFNPNEFAESLSKQLNAETLGDNIANRVPIQKDRLIELQQKQNEKQRELNDTTGVASNSKANQPDFDIPELPLNPKGTTKVEFTQLQQNENEQKSTKTDNILHSQLELTNKQNTKIDQQLQQMVNSNNYLKVIAETNPKLVDLAEKQLAVSTMNEQQKERVAMRMKGESAKFNANYNYAV
ncbi:MAG: hypothetical protein ACXW2E_02055 [Nitrososphaeraceae archaeon]